MKLLNILAKGVSLILVAASLSACSSVPDDTLEASVLNESAKLVPDGYEADEWEVTNEYLQDVEGDEYNVIEYSITYQLGEDAIKRLRGFGLSEYEGRAFDEIISVQGRLFFIQKGSKWYASHQKL